MEEAGRWTSIRFWPLEPHRVWQPHRGLLRCDDIDNYGGFGVVRALTRLTPDGCCSAAQRTAPLLLSGGSRYRSDVPACMDLRPCIRTQIHPSIPLDTGWHRSSFCSTPLGLPSETGLKLVTVWFLGGSRWDRGSRIPRDDEPRCFPRPAVVASLLLLPTTTTIVLCCLTA